MTKDNCSKSTTSPEVKNQQPPSYEEAIQVAAAAQLVDEAAAITDDGRVTVDLNSRLAKVLSKFIPDAPDFSQFQASQDIKEALSWTVKLNIVIQVVGSRGDVQPFVALGNQLQKYGHRVRLATHDTFQNFVKSNGLEFYPIGGDPEELMAYMVKNPGLIPSMKSFKEGDIQKKRAMIAEMLEGFWASCIGTDPMTGEPFVADAIIANPPSFAHIHCAQALGIPIHLMFTMPWSNTRAFPHPIANLKNAQSNRTVANWISYSVVEWMTWQGLGDIINKWRKKLDLEPIGLTDGPNLASTLKIPFTYCWSPALVPKPMDWPSHIDICGFFFRNPPDYQPPSDLDSFLRAGPPPVYIGFGSIVLDNPDRMSSILIEAIQNCGVRAIISRGWSKLNGPESKNIFCLGDCPHEWLFQHVAAVVHHGGAGTTACGLLNGKPTLIVPFFGDQPFWGNMVAVAGAGPKPIHHKLLNPHNLAEAITFCLTPQASHAANQIALKMKSEAGVQTAANSFHMNLPLETIPCDILPDQPAVWKYTRKNRTVKLSKIAAELLVEHMKIDSKNLKIYRSKSIVIETHYYDPVTAASSAMIQGQMDFITSCTELFTKPYQAYRDGQTSSKASLKSASGSLLDVSAKSSEMGGANWERDSSIIDDPVQHRSTAGAMTAASAKSVGNFYVQGFKTAVVDIPFAIAEGLRNVPSLYNDDVRDYGHIKGWKSGAIAGGRSFAYGMSEGLTDIFTKPYEGAKEEGVLGALKGVGKGTISLATKTTSGVLGLVAYPGQGIARSIRTACKTTTKNCIIRARHNEGEHFLRLTDDKFLNHGKIIAIFEELMKGNIKQQER